MTQLNHNTFTRAPRKSKTPQCLINNLIIMTQNNDFDLSVLEAILHSVSFPKNIFISKIRDDVNLTARILKYFPGDEVLVNYSDITLTAHILLFCLQFDNVDVVMSFRKKIEANNIWDIKQNKSGIAFEIIEKIRSRVRREDVMAVVEQVREWYEKLGTVIELRNV